jgi:hypothetical protein
VGDEGDPANDMAMSSNIVTIFFDIKSILLLLAYFVEQHSLN